MYYNTACEFYYEKYHYGLMLFDASNLISSSLDYKKICIF